VSGPAPRHHARIAAAILASLLAGMAVLTYLSYGSAFSETDTVTVSSPRAGLVMEIDGKVKYRGLQIGKVIAIDYSGGQARLTVAIERDKFAFIPSNAPVRIAATTVFGAKSVEFLPPDSPSPLPLRPGAHVQAASVSVEANTVFQTLTDVLNKIDPVELNATLTALSDGMRGRGNDLGATLAGLNTLAAQANPALPTVQRDLVQTAAVANSYADAGANVVKLIDNTPPINTTIVGQQHNLTDTLLATIGLANNGYAALAPAADDYIAAVQRLRAPLKVVGDYSPVFGCLFKGIAKGLEKLGPYLGGIKPGLFLSSSFLLGGPSYTYPQSLPIVNASGGPNCRGLPNVPAKTDGSWYHTPFLVTDNAYIPYEPNTELQVDAPSTLQFLFNGAYAERDHY
jgi:phospholipid/cholesterol/gamma-HCH transport system substrate-binding protein